jgi:sulfotransferase family protein
VSAQTAPFTQTGEVKGRVPDFFIVGQPKSGTTALYEMLRGHPQVFMPDMKEPLFFASDLRPYLHTDASDPGRRALFPATYEEYLSLFDAATAEQRIGEASSSYLRSRVAAGAIAEAQPAARIIAILREPASLLRSLHLQRLQEKIETEGDLRRAISLEDDRRRGISVPARLEQPQMLMYSEFIHYVEQLRRFDAVFAPEQITVLIYDDFRDDNERIVRGVLRFLDVDHTFAIKPLTANPTVAIRSPRLERLSHRATAGRGAVWGPASAIVKGLTSKRLRRRVLYPFRNRLLYREPPPPDEGFMLELRRRYQPEVRALSEYLDRDLVTLWGYDRLS